MYINYGLWIIIHVIWAWLAVLSGNFPLGIYAFTWTCKLEHFINALHCLWYISNHAIGPWLCITDFLTLIWRIWNQCCSIILMWIMLIIVNFFWFFNKLEAKFGVENNLMGSLVCLDIPGWFPGLHTNTSSVYDWRAFFKCAHVVSGYLKRIH